MNVVFMIECITLCVMGHGHGYAMNWLVIEDMTENDFKDENIQEWILLNIFKKGTIPIGQDIVTVKKSMFSDGHEVDGFSESKSFKVKFSLERV